MFDVVRLYVLTSLTQAGYLYAVWSVFRQGARKATAPASPDTTAYGEGGFSDGCTPQTGSGRRAPMTLDTSALKLCIIMTAMGALVLLGADSFPLFPEFRVIAMYLLLFAPPSTQTEVYDKAFSPLLVKCGNLARSAQSSDFLTKRVCLFVVHRLVSLAIVIMNYVDRCGVLEPDAIKDVLGGLVFSRRALDDIAAQQKEKRSASPTFVESLLSNFNSNNGSAALRDYATSLASTTSSVEGLTTAPASATPSMSSALSASSDYDVPTHFSPFVLSAMEEVPPSDRGKRKKKS